MINREVVVFEIKDKVITYKDRKWQKGIQFMPKDFELVKKLIFSRNRIPMSSKLLDWIEEANTGKSLEEYKSAKSEEELAAIVRRDAKKKGLIEFKAKLDEEVQDEEKN